LLAVAPGFRRVEAVFEVDNPRLWWPRPLGAANLYSLDVQLACGGSSCGNRAARFGIREIVLAQELTKVNGLRLRWRNRQ
jgi:beta-galactosidase/beta-glucuronidase